MRTGTNHFVSEVAAVTYYCGYYPSRLEAAIAVARKIRTREIAIGEPKLKDGETLLLIDNGTRYAIGE